MPNFLIVSFDENGNRISIGTKAASSNIYRIDPSYLEIAKANTDKLSIMKLVEIREANRRMDEKIVEVNKEYATFEPSTWEIQRTEWLAYTQDPASNTPYVNRLALIRGLTRDAIMQRIEAKVVGYADIQGTLHSAIDQIESAADEATLADVVRALPF